MMLYPLARSVPRPTSRVQPSATRERLAPYREALRQINWKLIVFCVALWWFIYSAPTEGILTSYFSSASTVSSADDF